MDDPQLYFAMAEVARSTATRSQQSTVHCSLSADNYLTASRKLLFRTFAREDAAHHGRRIGRAAPMTTAFTKSATGSSSIGALEA